MKSSALLVPALLGAALVGAIALTRAGSSRSASNTSPSTAPGFDGVGRTARMLRRGTERT